MAGFDELPFDEQLAWIRRRTDAPAALIKEASALADVEPLCVLIDHLASSGRPETELVSLFREAFERLADPALQYLLLAPLSEPAARDARLELAKQAAERWSLERVTALALLHRWLREHDPEFLLNLRATAAERTTRHADPSAARWLFFLDGHRLAQLALDREWSKLVQETTRTVLDRLARAAKSLSQANAEALLSRQLYADPGHFLFELMQNADDARASEWSVRIDEDRTTVTHDGTPFSFLDVVGICSIGLTTKDREQIGFFGVGFKSVYEVTARPQIYSGAFNFEIAHVSMPRPIAPLARDTEPGGTTLILPHDERVDADMLARRASAIPPETLMTLPHLRRLSVGLSATPDQTHVEEREGHLAVLRSASSTRVYEVLEDSVEADGVRSPLLIAALIDPQDGPVARDEPGLFSFLPTSERTGLPVLVHARFEVTVDRERLESESARNDALLKAAGERYAALIERIAGSDRSVLEILPVPGELTPLVQPMRGPFLDALLDVRCLPRADGGSVSPRHGRIVDPRLIEPLSALDLGHGDRALSALTKRQRDAVTLLGARRFTDEQLCAWFAERLSTGDPAPSWLDHNVRAVLADAQVSDDRLRALPLFFDADERLVAARDARVASAEWARVYAGIRPLVPEDQLAQLEPRLLDRLSPSAFDPLSIAGDLEKFPQLLDRVEPLLLALRDASAELIASLRDVPLFLANDGDRYAVSDGIARLETRLEPLRPALSEQMLLIDSAEAIRHPELVAHALPAFSLDTLLDAFDSGLSLPRRERARLVAILDDEAAKLTSPTLQRISRLPLFDDVHGEARPLTGPTRALVTAHAALVDLVPAWPWLTEPDRAFVQLAQPPPFDARATCERLLEQPPIGSQIPALLDWIAARAGELRGSDIEALAGGAIWPDFEDQPRPLNRLRAGVSSEAVNRFYEMTGLRRVAHPSVARACRALRLFDALPSSDHEAVVTDLLVHDEPETIPNEVVRSFLLDAITHVSSERLTALLALPLFEDVATTARPIASLTDARVDHCHHPGAFRAMLRDTRWPLVSEEVETELGPFFDHVQAPRATVVDLVRLGSELDIGPAALLDALLENRDAIDVHTRNAIAQLPLFESRAKNRALASELGVAAVIDEHLSPEQRAALRLDARLLSDDAAAAVRTLGLTPRSSVSIVEVVLSSIDVGAELDAQPPGAQTPTDLLALLGLALALELDASSLPLALDQRRRVVRGPLLDGSEAVRALAEQLPLAERLAHVEWANDPRAQTRLEPITARMIATALAAAAREEVARDAHPVLSRPEAVFGWIREHKEALDEDSDARSAFGVARVLPSARGTLRAASELVLDPDAPDLALQWGLASDVPDDVADWLGATYEMDRRQRRALVEHVLDGIDAAVEAEDASRVTELVRFLAAALSPTPIRSGERTGAETIEHRARRLKVRARLRVPSHDGTFVKPRFGWAPTKETASLASAFMETPPPELGLTQFDEASRALLSACGAATDLSESDVEHLLAGDGVRDGATARVALARYVIFRASAEPRLIERWKLDRRAWVPNREGTVRRPRELLWPDPSVRALFDDDVTGVPDDAVLVDLPSGVAQRLGFSTIADLSPKAIARRLGGQVASPELLEWLERGLLDERMTPKAVAQAFGETLLLMDDEGLARPVSELAIGGARDLFGHSRGDASGLEETPKLAHALSVPRSPDLSMMLSFLEERGDALSDMSEGERQECARHLPDVYRRIAARLREGADVSLPAGAVGLAIKSGVTRLVTGADPALVVLGPPSIAEVVREDVADSLLVLELIDDALARLWLGVGIADLLAGSKLIALEPGPAAVDRNADGLHERLVESLGDSAGKRAQVHVSLLATYELSSRIGSGQPLRVKAEVDAALERDTLFVTPRALEDPTLIAPALETEPQKRAALMRWLADESRTLKEADVERARGPKPKRQPRNWLDRVADFFRSPEPTLPRVSSPRTRAKKRPNKTRVSKPLRDAAMFRPRHQVSQQLGGSPGWSERRAKRPDFGFRFSPRDLDPPWLYAPKIVATEFDHRTQSWRPTRLAPPPVRGRAGVVEMRGLLPKGDSIVPLPLYARIESFRPESALQLAGPSGGVMARLDDAGDVSIKLILGEAPDAGAARIADQPSATVSFVPDDELPDEVLEFVDQLNQINQINEVAPLDDAFAVRDFVRRRYRYDPTYLEDPSVGRWLSRVARGRSHAHVAALHAGADNIHLGAGVCYELNSLTCELLRRVGIPAGIATGWVFTDGALSAPDHLWVIAFLESSRGEPLWLPIDASSTVEGRPLTVPARPPVKTRAPKPPNEKAPRASGWDRKKGRNERRRERKRAGPTRRPATGSIPSIRKRPSTKGGARPPKAEMRRILSHLERRTGREVTPEERRRLEAELESTGDARKLLKRLLK